MVGRWLALGGWDNALMRTERVVSAQFCGMAERDGE